MSDRFSKVEAISGVARRRRFSTELKLAVVAETMQSGMSTSYIARRHGLYAIRHSARRALTTEIPPQRGR
jgi:transposase-like protein